MPGLNVRSLTVVAALSLALASPGFVRAQEAASPGPAGEGGPPANAPTEGGLAFSHKTEIVDGPALQVVFGERAVFHLNDKGEPVLDEVQKGQLAIAHPAGAVKESFDPPGPGKLAIALDGSPEKQASYLKLWNGLDHPVLYRAGVLAYEGGVLKPVTVKVCATAGGETSSMTWPAPIAAAVVANFTAAPDANACN